MPHFLVWFHPRRVCLRGTVVLRTIVLGSLVGTAACGSAADRTSPLQPQLWTPTQWSTANYESSPTFSPDGREAYFMRASPDFSGYRLLMSRCENGQWSTPQTPAFASAPPGQDADPWLTPDGRRIYFISTRQNTAPDDGDFDIWYADRARDGHWEAPVRLPEPINSPASELLPRATRDGRLFFGSDRPGGYGRSDIYVALPDPQARWSVRNVGPPVSTAHDEYEADVSRDGNTLVVVADRGDRSHLYVFARESAGWKEKMRVPARDDVFQVGPLLSPDGDRLLFAQADGARSGELFLFELSASPASLWPPSCNQSGSRITPSRA